MIEALLQQRYYVAAVVLFSIGFVTLFLHPNLIKKIIGMNLMDTAVFLFLAAMGYVDGGKAPMVEPGAAAAYVNPASFSSALPLLFFLPVCQIRRWPPVQSASVSSPLS